MQATAEDRERQCKNWIDNLIGVTLYKASHIVTALILILTVGKYSTEKFMLILVSAAYMWHKAKSMENLLRLKLIVVLNQDFLHRISLDC